MKPRRHTPDQIIRKLREADRLLALSTEGRGRRRRVLTRPARQPAPRLQARPMPGRQVGQAAATRTQHKGGPVVRAALWHACMHAVPRVQPINSNRRPRQPPGRPLSSAEASGTGPGDQAQQPDRALQTGCPGEGYGSLNCYRTLHATAGAPILAPPQEPPACARSRQAADRYAARTGGAVGVASDLPAGTCSCAGTDEAADPLCAVQLHGCGRERPRVGPARGRSPVAGHLGGHRPNLWRVAAAQRHG
jgi:hypothetical protein